MDHHDFTRPYAAPKIPAENDWPTQADDGYLGEARVVPAGRAIAWFRTAWLVFKRQPVLWMVAGLFYLVVHLFFAFIPYVGGILQMAAHIFLVAGFSYAADQVNKHGRFTFDDILNGFQNHAGRLGALVGLSLAYMLLMAVVSIVMVMLFNAFGGMHEGTDKVYSAVFMTLTFLLTLIYTAAFYLAPVLIVLQNETVKRALGLSWQAFARNIGAASLCLTLLALAVAAAVLTFGLGFLMLIPMILVLSYTTYRDVFFKKP